MRRFQRELHRIGVMCVVGDNNGLSVFAADGETPLGSFKSGEAASPMRKIHTGEMGEQ